MSSSDEEDTALSRKRGWPLYGSSARRARISIDNGGVFRLGTDEDENRASAPIRLPTASTVTQTQSYQFQPLRGPNSIRIVELLAGMWNQDINIKLHHQDLSDLSACEALSYEWGTPYHRVAIYCGPTVLRITCNLFAALKRLRQPNESRMLWIDAICIDQHNSEEKSQQVPLMREIYKTSQTVLLWIGEEVPEMKAVFDTLPVLAEAFKTLNIPEEKMGEMGSQFKTWVEVPSGEQLVQLTSQRLWAAMVNLVSERNYFTRLWVIQEIALSNKAVLLCGEHIIEWEIFQSATRLIYVCAFLQRDMKNFLITTNICAIQHARSVIKSRRLKLWEVISGFLNFEVTNERDRIFGVLGMTTGDEQAPFISVNYTKSSEKIFQEAGELIAVTEQHLGIWQYTNLAISVRSGLGIRRVPSWTPNFGGYDKMFTLPGADLLPKDANRGRISVCGDIMITSGFIFDSIAETSNGFTEHGLKYQILCAIPKLSVSAAYQTMDLVHEAFWQSLIAFNPSQDDAKKWVQEFDSLISQWYLEHYRITPDMVAKNPPSEHLAANCPELTEKFKNDIQGGVDLQELVFKSDALQCVLENAAKGTGQEFETRMRRTLCDKFHDFSRQLLTSSKGYIGIGPGGNYGSITVQSYTKDVIAIVAGAFTPMILRPTNGGMYTLIGPAYIGGLKNALCLKEENMPDLVEIRIC